MAAEDEVRRASARFYSALSGMTGGDTSAMSAVWAHSADVTAMHPIGDRDEGWSKVQATFDQVGSMAGGGQVRITNQLIRVGADLAYEVGVEEGEVILAGETITIKQRVTNVYRREGGEWKMVHHHGDISPAMTDLLMRMQQKQSEKAA